ncbi:hypothetical protein J503_4274 [Acinetobacter baumannii 984213]|nr:hypothetical protein J503_4274 [Acinetobacter baumannii 984213]
MFKKALVIALMGVSSFTFAGNWQGLCCTNLSVKAFSAI